MNIRLLQWISAALLVTLATACTTAPSLPTAERLFNDALFTPPAEPIRPDEVFALSPEMQRYAATELEPRMRHDGAEQALVDALYDKGRLQLEYDATSTRTAAGAFEARTGNCLSLVVMTGAFAEHFGLTVVYQEVFTKAAWSRSSRLALSNRHVNLRFLPSTTAPQLALERGRADRSDEGMTVDFLPSERAAQYRVRAISREVVIAMFMNNRAAELLADGKPDAAYWWAREAIRRVPTFMDSYNLLAVIYRQHGNLAQAEYALRQALALEPENSIPMSNLVGVLDALGRTEESRQLALRLAQIEPFPPFHFYDLGLAALQSRDFAQARQWFQREINRDADHAESHFGLAIAHLQLGDLRKARAQLALAVAKSTTRQSRALFSAKLDWLKSQGYASPHDRSGVPSAADG